MNALITGGAGFIGSHLATAWLRLGGRVRVLDDLSLGREANLAEAYKIGPVDFVVGDTGDSALLQQSLQGCNYVFHLAALPSVSRSIEAPVPSHAVNLSATLTLLDVCRTASLQRVVFAGSSSVYGDQPTAAKHEKLPPKPLSPYALQKYAAEQYGLFAAKHHGVPFVSTRFFNVFGPRQAFDSPYAGVVARFCTRMLAGEAPTIYGDGQQARDFTYVENVIDGLIRAATAPPGNSVGRVFNLACGNSITVLRLVEDLNELTGQHLLPVFAPARAGDVVHSCADISAAAEALGYRPTVDWITGLTQTLAWYRKKGAENDPRIIGR